MRLLLVVTTLLAIPGAAFAQSTVGSVPSNPNAMPAVDGSSSPTVKNAGPAPAVAAPAKSTKSHKHSRKVVSNPG